MLGRRFRDHRLPGGHPRASHELRDLVLAPGNPLAGIRPCAPRRPGDADVPCALERLAVTLMAEERPVRALPGKVWPLRLGRSWSTDVSYFFGPSFSRRHERSGTGPSTCLGGAGSSNWRIAGAGATPGLSSGLFPRSKSLGSAGRRTGLGIPHAKMRDRPLGSLLENTNVLGRLWRGVPRRPKQAPDCPGHVVLAPTRLGCGLLLTISSRLRTPSFRPLTPRGRLAFAPLGAEATSIRGVTSSVDRAAMSSSIVPWGHETYIRRQAVECCTCADGGRLVAARQAPGNVFDTHIESWLGSGGMCVFRFGGNVVQVGAQVLASRCGRGCGKSCEV